LEIFVISLDTRLANFLDSLAFFADIKRQQATWTGQHGAISSFISLGEAYAQFFDDNDIDNFIAEELDTSTLHPEQKKAIRVFRDALNSFSKAPGSENQVPDCELVNDSEWGNLVTLAKSTLLNFKNHN
jgi:hypothetical protein